MTKHNTIVLSVALILSVAIGLTVYSGKSRRTLSYSSVAFKTVNGWGYNIFVNDSLFIRQETIPALAGKNGFDQKDQAEQTAQLIINKMKRGWRPVVTTFEVKEILSSTNLQHETTGTTK